MTAAPHEAAPATVELAAGDLRLAVRADLGASIAGLWHAGLPVLRSTEPADLQGARPSACYPLVPYSNRIGFRRFRWHGKDYTTEPNFDADNPHSVHGVGWLRPWRIERQAASEAELRYTHAADAHWPFAFEARQHFALTTEGVELRLAMTNTEAQSQPAGLGWHPYFPKRERSRIHIECAERWESDPTTQLPTRHVTQPGIDGEVKHLDFDHCFQGWTGAARLRDEKLSLKLTSSLGYLVVYTPAQKAYFCVEPVSHVSNAIHLADPLAHGLVALAPGETLEAWMKIDISPA